MTSGEMEMINNLELENLQRSRYRLFNINDEM